jgi:predicted HicB family RNase H-like nuclease
MTVSKAQQKAVKEYMKKNYDELKVRVQKGQKEVIKAHADRRGESLNGFIKRAIDETIQRESGEE